MRIIFLLPVLLVVAGVAFWWGNQSPLIQTSDTTDVEQSNPLENAIVTPIQKANDAKTQLEGSSGLILDLRGQGLTKAPSYIFEKTQTTKLDLSHNQIGGALQAEIRHLQNLRTLDVSNNNFTGVPAEVGQLKNLEVLDLSNNQLTGLPYELGNLSNLKTLNLSGNAVSQADLKIIRDKLPSSVNIIE